MEKFKNEDVNYLYLQSINIGKTLPKLVKKLKNKKVVIYGTGSFFQCIKKYYDITGFNMVGIADRNNFVHGSDNLELLIDKYYDIANIEIAGITDKKDKLNVNSTEYDEICVDKLEDIKSAGVDCIIVSLKNYADVIETLHEKFKDTKIKIKPLASKPIRLLYKEL